LYVFVHGLGGCKNHFEQAFFEVPAGRGVLAVDLPGFGESDRFPEETDYSFAAHAAVLGEVLCRTTKDLGAARIVLTVHSMASGLLPEILALEIQPFAGLALLEGNLVPEDAEWSRRIVDMGEIEFQRYFTSLQKGGQYALAAELKAPQSKAELKRLAVCYCLADSRAFRATAAHALADTNAGLVIHALRKFTGPKLYLRGSQSSPWAGWSALSEADVSGVVIEHSAHFPHVDNPKQTYSTIYAIQ
jgi:pimeloyl-ACP methyl ester carboxylesterase